MKRCFLGLVFLQFVMAAGVANAQYFKITNRTYGQAANNAQARAEAEKAFDELENEVNKVLAEALNTKDLDKYLDGTANAFSLANKGIGVDYGADMKLFLAGLQFAAAVDTTDLGVGDLVGGDVDGDKINGGGVNLTLFAGLNLGFLPFGDIGPIKLDRTKVFVNFMTYDAEDLGDVDGSVKVSSFGAHVQYKLIEPITAGSALLARWNGVDVTAGMNVSNLEISAEQDDIKESASEGAAQIEFDGKATVGIDISTFSIPVEISTGGNLFYFLGGYVGLGVDINTGSAKPQGNVSGTISSPNDAGVSGDADLSLSKEGEPTGGTMRMFAGLEINAAVLKVFAKYNQALNDDTMAITFGVAGGW